MPTGQIGAGAFPKEFTHSVAINDSTGIGVAVEEATGDLYVLRASSQRIE